MPPSQTGADGPEPEEKSPAERPAEAGHRALVLAATACDSRRNDGALSWSKPATATGRRVLVVGAGPGGLSAACHLARRGHEVEIREAGDESGGMMRYGIPTYRLPRQVLDGELARVEALGVRVSCGPRVTDLAVDQAEGRFDAVFVAVGAHLSRNVEIPARDASRIIDAVPFLRDVASGAVR